MDALTVLQRYRLLHEAGNETLEKLKEMVIGKECELLQAFFDASPTRRFSYPEDDTYVITELNAYGTGMYVILEYTSKHGNIIESEYIQFEHVRMKDD